MSTAGSLTIELDSFAMPVLSPPPVADELTKPTVLAVDQMEKAEAFRIAGGIAAVYTHRSPAKSTPNEDVAALIPVGAKQGVLIVADGLGGHAAGEQASQLAVKKIVDTIRRGGPDLEGDQLRPTILNGIEAANTAVRELGTGSASTLAIVEINRGVVRPYHVGDSVILLTGGRGRIKLQTIAHSPVGYAVEAGLMDEEDAIHHEDRHMISNVIGSEEMRIEIGPPVKLAPRDTLVLASDGLIDNLLPDEVVETVRRGPVGKSIGKLATTALTRMVEPQGDAPSKPDDLTTIVFRLG